MSIIVAIWENHWALQRSIFSNQNLFKIYFLSCNRLVNSFYSNFEKFWKQKMVFYTSIMEQKLFMLNSWNLCCHTKTFKSYYWKSKPQWGLIICFVNYYKCRNTVDKMMEFFSIFAWKIDIGLWIFWFFDSKTIDISNFYDWNQLNGH